MNVKETRESFEVDASECDGSQTLRVSTNYGKHSTLHLEHNTKPITSPTHQIRELEEEGEFLN